MTFSIKDVFGKLDQIRILLRIWSYLLKKPLMENFIFCAVGKLILTHLIGNNCSEFRNGFLDSYVFKPTLGSDYFELCFWTGDFKNHLIQ